MNLLGQSRTCDAHDVSDIPWGRRAGPSYLHVASTYLATALPLSPDAPGAHAVSLFTDGWLGQEAVRGRLIADPNACEVNDFGDRTPCTRLGRRSHVIALTRLHAPDPACAGRRLYAVTGMGLSDGLTLIVYPDGDRVELKLGKVIVPLHHEEA